MPFGAVGCVTTGVWAEPAPDAGRKTKGPAQQVDCQMRILEISKDGLKKLGVIWATLESGSYRAAAGESPAYPMRLGSLLDEARLDLSADPKDRAARLLKCLDSLVKSGDARVLSEPTLRALVGTRAELVVGGLVPISKAGNQTEEQDGGLPGQKPKPQVEHRPFGIHATLIPESVMEGGHIALRIRVEVSSVDHSQTVEVEGQRVPAFHVRQITSFIAVRGGETLALGGLVSPEQVKRFKDSPYVKETPLLAALFKREAFEKGETELAVLLTATVVDEMATPEILEQDRPGA